MLRFGMAVGLLTALLACQTEVVTPVVITRIQVDPGQAIVPEGDGLQFTATVFDDLDQAFEQAAVVWSSAAPRVLSVEADGAARALAPGVTRVRASLSGVSGTALVTVMSTPACARQRGRHKDKNDDDDEDDGDDDDDKDGSQCAAPE
jgi:hypothetical protein